MKYTGYKDKKGEPIYEGDTVDFFDYGHAKIEQDINKRWIITADDGDWIENLSEVYALIQKVRKEGPMQDKQNEAFYNQNFEGETLISCRASNSRFKYCTLDGGEYEGCHFEWCKLHDIGKLENCITIDCQILNPQLATNNIVKQTV